MAKTASGATASKRAAVTKPKNTEPASAEVTDAQAAEPVAAKAIAGVVVQSDVQIGPGEQIDGAGLDPVATARVRVSAKPKKGFWRAGRWWPRDGVEIERDSLSDAQWAALESEPKIVITPVE